MSSPSPPVDEAKAAAVLAVMRSAGSAQANDRVTYLEQLEGGWSRHSYTVTVAHDDGRERQYIVRARPRASTLDTDLASEFRTYALLHAEPVPTPAVHGMEAAEDTVFDGPFFVMDRMHGSAPNVWRPKDREALAEDWNGDRSLAVDLATHLAEIHSIGTERAAEAAISRDFRQTVDHWQGVYEEMRLVRDPVIDETYAWVRDREPEPVAPCLVHGDYRIGNCLIEQRRVTAILDWELAFVGDPRFDIGYISLDYHAGKFTTPGSSLLNAVAEREWFYERYSQLSGNPLDPEVVRTFSALGALMLFAIMTTGLRVYLSGQTTDIKMAWTRFALPGIRQDLTRLMGWGAG